MTLAGRRILLILGGGIAAYKVLELIRRLREAGAAVRPVMTAAAKEFVTPLSVASLAGERVYDDLFDLTDETEIGHIQLSRSADLVVVAPATADLLAKMAHGLAGDLATTLLLATDTPVLVAPAMNVRMWQHAATRRNVAQLRADGVAFIGPEVGDMACGETGPGRMAEPDAILAAIRDRIAPTVTGPLTGAHVLVTAGPTHEPIDPVRYIANRSSGKQGFAIAAACAALGAKVTLISGPVALPDPAGVTAIRVTTADEMLTACTAALPADAAVCAAAVGDWRAKQTAPGKIKKDGRSDATLALTANPDILATLSRPGPDRPRLVVGFAAETDDVVANAEAKRLDKGCDWILANDVSAATGIMGGDENAVHLVTATGVENWTRMSKTRVGEELAQRLAEALNASNVTRAPFGAQRGA